MDRKEFIKLCGGICVVGAGVSVLLEGCASATYFAQSVTTKNSITLKKAEFIKVANGKTTERKYVLLRTEKHDFPICVYKLKDGSYSALLLQCTHKGCELIPQGDFLVCPCHGSEFTNTGVVQNPPAEQNLFTFKITSDNEHLYIQL